MNYLNIIQKIYSKYYKKNIEKDELFDFQESLFHLKKFNLNWLDESLIEQRIDLLFDTHLSSKEDEIVFLTNINYLRDIFENNKIDINIHNPICFVTTPIAYYLFPEYSIHLYIDKYKLDSENNIDYKKIGGIINYSDSVKIDSSFINRLVCKNQSLINNINQLREDTGFNKFAVSLKQKGVFKIDADQRTIYPNCEVINKLNKKHGIVTSIEKGEHGNITIQYTDNSIDIVEQGDFDYKFVIY